MRFIASAFANRFDHPALAGVVAVALVFFLLAAALEVTTPFTLPLTTREVPPFAAGFFAVFGTLAGAIGVLAYGVLFAAKLVSIIRDRTAPTAA